MDIIRRLKFYWRAKTIFDIHSPFLFELLKAIFENNQQFYLFNELKSNEYSAHLKKRIFKLIHFLNYPNLMVYEKELFEDLNVKINPFNVGSILMISNSNNKNIQEIWKNIDINGGLVILGVGEYEEHRLFFESYNFNCNLYFYDFSLGFRIKGYLGDQHIYLVRWFYKPWRLGFF